MEKEKAFVSIVFNNCNKEVYIIRYKYNEINSYETFNFNTLEQVYERTLKYLKDSFILENEQIILKREEMGFMAFLKDKEFLHNVYAIQESQTKFTFGLPEDKEFEDDFFSTLRLKDITIKPLLEDMIINYGLLKTNKPEKVSFWLEAFILVNRFLIIKE